MKQPGGVGQRPGARIAALAARVTLRHLLIANAVAWLAVVLLWWRCGITGCPTVERLTAYQPDGASVLLDHSGEQFADLAPVEHEVVQLDSLPAHVAAAFVAVEDQRFYEHSGIDLRRVGGAIIADIKARAFVEGFSTITMQLARNVWPETLPGQQRTLRRKILEVRVARSIERSFEKDEILELYLNHIYFGSGAYGIAAAAHNYFGKSASELTLGEAALLASLPKSPVLYNPRRYPERAEERRDLVLGLMRAQGRIEADAAEAAQRDEPRVRRDPPAPRTADEPAVAPYFIEAVRRVLEDQLGETVYTTRLVIHTTLDLEAQRVAERELERQLDAVERGRFGRYDGIRHGPDVQEPDYVQGAVVLIDADSGDVRALVGGRDYEQSRFDRATRARRQVGSAFKPFVFAAALEQGFVPSQRIADTPLRMELAGGEVWEPQNYTGDFAGEVTLRDALVRSRNVPTIRLAADVGIDNVARIARRAGVRSPIPDVPSSAIGVAGMTPLELTAAYTMFANGGTAVAPRLVTQVEDSEGGIVWRSAPERRDVLEPDVAYLITDMLSDAVRRGTGTGVRDAGFTSAAAGKTGTTDNGADVWFVGYTPELVGGIWIGFDMPRPVVEDAAGGEIAAPLWGRIMRGVYAGGDAPDEWPRPDRIVERAVDPASGLVLQEGCRPLEGEPRLELFSQDDLPASTCPAGEPTSGERGLLARAGDWVARQWHNVTGWLSRHIGSEREQPAPPRDDERYLGVPRLPRAVEVDDPVIDDDSFRVRVQEPQLLGVPLDSIRTDSVTTDTTTLPLPDAPADTSMPQDSARPPDPASPPDTSSPPASARL